MGSDERVTTVNQTINQAQPTIETPAESPRASASDRAELARRWQARCASGAFSAGVRGVGTVRIFGKAGDAPLTYPRIESLAALADLEPDEQWALTRARAVVMEARSQRRAIVATRTRPDAAPDTRPIGDFDPAQESILILNHIVGG